MTRLDSRHAPLRPVDSSRERGFAYLMALFMVMIVIAGSTMIVVNMRTEGRRQREEEAIWRGKQYARAIRLYFHKTGKYPQNLDELVKGMPQLHFLRQAYKDPMNSNDGSWGFIYVNAAGQIIGSTKYSSLQQMALLDSGALQPGQQGQIPGQPGVPVSSLTSSANMGGAGNNSSDSIAGAIAGAISGATGSTQNPAQPGQQDPGQTPGTPDPSGQNPGGPAPTPQPGPTGMSGATQASPFGQASGQPVDPAAFQKPTGPVDGPVLGAFMTGVASKVDAPSQKVYKQGKKYLQWEFIWNPLEDAAADMQQSLNPQGQQPGLGQPIGANPFGQPGASNPGMGSGAGQTPTPAPQAPQQTPQQ